MESGTLPTLLQELRGELEYVLGDRIQAMYMYGSQARGDARPDSDLDVLVVLNGDFHYFDMIERTGEIAARLSLAYDTVISLTFSSADQFYSQKIPFFLNVRQEGIII